MAGGRRRSRDGGGGYSHEEGRRSSRPYDDSHDHGYDHDRNHHQSHWDRDGSRRDRDGGREGDHGRDHRDWRRKSDGGGGHGRSGRHGFGELGTDPLGRTRDEVGRGVVPPDGLHGSGRKVPGGESRSRHDGAGGSGGGGYAPSSAAASAGAASGSNRNFESGRPRGGTAAAAPDGRGRTASSNVPMQGRNAVAKRPRSTSSNGRKDVIRFGNARPPTPPRVKQPDPAPKPRPQQQLPPLQHQHRQSPSHTGWQQPHIFSPSSAMAQSHRHDSGVGGKDSRWEEKYRQSIENRHRSSATASSPEAKAEPANDVVDRLKKFVQTGKTNGTRSTATSAARSADTSSLASLNGNANVRKHSAQRSSSASTTTSSSAHALGLPGSRNEAGRSSKALPNLKTAGPLVQKKPTRNELLKKQLGQGARSKLSGAASSSSAPPSLHLTMAAGSRPTGSPSKRGNRLLSATIEKPTKRMQSQIRSAGGPGAAQPKLPVKRRGRAAAAMYKENQAKDSMEVPVCAVGRQQKSSKIIPSGGFVEWKNEMVHIDKQTQQLASRQPKLGVSRATEHGKSHSTVSKVAPSQLDGAWASSQKAGVSIGDAGDLSAKEEMKLGGEADAKMINEAPHTKLPALRSDREITEAPPQKEQENPLLPEKEQKLLSEKELAPTTGRRIHTVHGITLDLDAAEPLHFVSPSIVAIAQPDDYDVLLGRDFQTNSHPGNKRFLDLVEVCREDYNNCVASEKSSVPRKIVQAIRNANPPTRFLKSEPADGQWYDVGCEEAVKICSEIFRGTSSEITAVMTAVDASPADEEVQEKVDFGCRMRIVTDDSHGESEGIAASSRNFPFEPNSRLECNEKGSNEDILTHARSESDDENRSTTPSLCGSSPTLPAKVEVAGGGEEEKEEKSHSTSIDGSVVLTQSSFPGVELVERGTQKNACSATSIDGKRTRITVAVHKKSASSASRKNDAMSIDRKPTVLKIAASKKLCSNHKDDDSIISISSTSSSCFSSSSVEVIENENDLSRDTSKAMVDRLGSEAGDRGEGYKETESVGSHSSGSYDSSDDDRSMKMTFLSESDFKSSPGDVPMSIDVNALGPETINDAKRDAALPSSGPKPAVEATVAHAETPLSPTDCRGRSVPSKDPTAIGGALPGRKRPLNRSASSVYSDGARKKIRRLHSSGDKTAAREGELASAAPRPLMQGRTSDDLSLMECVPHLTRTELDATTGKPVHYITAYSKTLDILYDFKISVKPSRIPNSGSGAYLTYLGARLLNADRRFRSNDLLINSAEYEVETAKPQTAAFRSTGLRANVTLTGKDLHENDGCRFWPDTADFIPGVMPITKKRFTVKLEGKNIHDIGEDLLKSRDLHQGETPIGFRHFHKESHYEEAPLSFCSYYEGCGLVDIGRYGPFRVEDRKTELDFHIKDFIFEHEPAGWNFGVSEKLRGQTQNIDITEDFTGEPHTDAKEHVPMYVNEVGHSKELAQNVLSLEQDSRVVHYYFHTEEPLRKGQEVELLTTYYASYENVRERKGYGKANMEKEVKSDYDCVKTKTLRNLCDRYHLEDTVESMTGEEVMSSLRFINDSILKPVVASTDWYIKKSALADQYWSTVKEEDKEGRSTNGAEDVPRFPTTQPPSRQWVARRRMHWFHGRYKAKIEELKKSGSIRDKNLDEADAIVAHMRWVTLHGLFPIMNHVKLSSGIPLGKAMAEELQEELFFLASKDLVGLFEGTLWCPIAEQLGRKVSKLMAAFLFTNQRNGKSLLDPVLKEANTRASMIKKACAAINNSDMIPAHIREESVKKALEALEFRGTPRHVGGKHAQSSTFPLLKKLFEIKVEASEGDGSVVVALPKAQDQPNSEKAEAKAARLFRDGEVSPSTDWYLQWQIVYVVDALARSFDLLCSQDSVLVTDAGKWFSLDDLCREVGVDHQKAKAALEHGRAKASIMEQFSEQSSDNVESVNEKKHSSKRQRRKLTAKKKCQKTNTSPMSASSSGSQRPPHNKRMFNATIWKCLEQECGWRLEIKGREKGRNDAYFFPPGVSWGDRNRCDFFDSVPLVVDFVQTDGRWKDRNEVKTAVDRYYRGMEYVNNLRQARQLPKAYQAEWILKHMDANTSALSRAAAAAAASASSSVAAALSSTVVHESSQLKGSTPAPAPAPATPAPASTDAVAKGSNAPASATATTGASAETASAEAPEAKSVTEERG